MNNEIMDTSSTVDEMQDQVFEIVTADVNPEYIPKNHKQFVKELEKKGVKCEITNKGSCRCKITGSLSSVVNVSLYLKKKTPHIFRNGSESPETENLAMCRAVNGYKKGSTGSIERQNFTSQYLEEKSQNGIDYSRTTKQIYRPERKLASNDREKYGSSYTQDYLNGSKLNSDDLKSSDFNYTSYLGSAYLETSGEILEFKTPTGRHKISIYCADLTKIKADAVVCPTNHYLAHGAGVAKAIAKVGGSQVTDAANLCFERSGGSFYPSCVTFIKGGQLPSKFVIYAVGPVWKEYKNESDYMKTLQQTFLNCLKLASEELMLNCIALPLIGAGVYGGPVDKACQALYDALMEFDGGTVCANMDIHIVDMNKESIKLMQSLFSSISEGKNSPNKLPVVKDFLKERVQDKAADHDRMSPMNRYDKSTQDNEDFRAEFTSERHTRPSSIETVLFKTPIRHHQVSLYMENITVIKADAIVNAANSDLVHAGGVAKSIAEAGGYQVVRESRQYIQKRGSLSPSEVIHTTAGNLPSNYVIHAVGPVWRDYDKKECLAILEKTFKNCLLYASNKLKATSIALPLISSGTFGVPIDECIRVLYSAIMKFDRGGSTIMDIDIVDINPKSVERLQLKFRKYLKRDKIQFNERSRTLSTFANARDFYGFVSHRYLNNNKDVRKETHILKATKVEEPTKVRKSTSLSRIAGPMKANSSEEFVKYLIEDYERKGNPPSKFKEVQNEIEQILASDAVLSKGKRSSSLGRLPDHSLDIPTSGDRQSRLDTIGKESSAGKRRSQSLDRRKSTADSEKKKQMSKNKNQTLDRKKNTVEENFNHAVAKCSTCHNTCKLRERKDCMHMICTFCISRNCKICTYCNHSNEYHKRSVTDSTDGKQLNESARLRRRDRDKINKELTIKPTGNDDGISLDTMDRYLMPQPHLVDESCPICFCKYEDSDCEEPMSLINCGHTFCKNCIVHAFKSQPKCPICGLIYGSLTGNQPPGSMKARDQSFSLPGYPDTKTIIIEYNIPPGIQNDSHPNPGHNFNGTRRTAYLPGTKEGHDVYKLLKKAFDAKLIFTVGRSVTTGRADTVTWNDIHHKTNIDGGPSQFGYPDDTYLKRVRSELASKGIK